MNKIKICLWASTQENNLGVADYGTEEQNMFSVCDKVEAMLNKFGIFEIHRNEPSWGLIDNCNQEKKVEPDFVVEVHSNAGGGEGTEIFCNLQNPEGMELSQHLYNNVAPISLGEDRGIKDGMWIYDIKNTKATTVLIELFFHDNEKEVREWKVKEMQYARAITKGICDFVNPTLFDDGLKYTQQELFNRLSDIIDKLNDIKNYLGGK